MVKLLGCNWQRHRVASPRQSNMWRWPTGTHPTDQWLLQSVSHLPPLRSDNGYFQLDVPYVPAEYAIYVEEVEHHLHKGVKHISGLYAKMGSLRYFQLASNILLREGHVLRIWRSAFVFWSDTRCHAHRKQQHSAAIFVKRLRKNYLITTLDDQHNHVTVILLSAYRCRINAAVFSLYPRAIPK